MLQVDVRVADAELLADEQGARRVVQERFGREHSLGRPQDEERPEGARLEGRLGRRQPVLDLESGPDVVPLARVEDPDPAAELPGPLEGARARAARRRAARPSSGTSGSAPTRRGRAARSRRGRRPGCSSWRATPRLPPSRPAARPAPTRTGEPSGARPTRPRASRGRRSTRRRAPGGVAPTRTSDAATAIARSGARKIRWRDSGDAEPPSRASEEGRHRDADDDRGSARVPGAAGADEPGQRPPRGRRAITGHQPAVSLRRSARGSATTPTARRASPRRRRRRRRTGRRGRGR